MANWNGRVYGQSGYIQIHIISQLHDMGPKNTKIIKEQAASAETITQAIEGIFSAPLDSLTLESVTPHILTISRNISEAGISGEKDGSFYVSSTVLKCVCHSQFETTMRQLLLLLAKELKSTIQAKLILLIPRQKFRKCLNLANFCVYITDQSLIQTINLLSVRTDLHEETRLMVRQLGYDAAEVPHLPLSALPREEMAETVRILRLSLIQMIDLHMKIISRSELTLRFIDSLGQSIFVLYSKLYFSLEGEIPKRQRDENSKALVRIGAYFLGLGIEKKIASIYEIAVILLNSVMQTCKQTINQSKALPSHLFKTLPLVNNNEMVFWITYNLLQSLKLVYDGIKRFNKMNVNRISAFKLLQTIFRKLKPMGDQITYILEEICIQTKPDMIERVYVSSLAEHYSKIEDMKSEIIRKYSQTKQVSYNIKSASKSFKIRPQQIMTELQNDDETLHRQMSSLSSKYAMQIIFHKVNLAYDYNDKALWHIILYNMEEGSELSGKGELSEEVE